MKHVALFASGVGTNALNLMRKSYEYSGVDVACVVVDTSTSPLPGIFRNEFPHVPVFIELPDRTLSGILRKKEHEERIIRHLDRLGVEWILLCGYMRILGEAMLSRFPQRIFNIHPSLLPKYPGADSYRRAFDDGATASGVTVHVVDAGVDTGPVFLQEEFPRLKNDSLEDFIQRGKEVEWKLYPRVFQYINDSIQPGLKE
jgi:phosphoribosylglycinamide formyltransferase 1